MDPFYASSLNYAGVPPESKLASYTAVGRSPVLGNMSTSTNHLSQNLATLSLDGAGLNHNIAGSPMSNMDPQLYQKPHASYSSARSDNISPAPPGNNGTPPLSRNSTPVPGVFQNVWMEQENVGGTTYFYNAEEGQGQELIQEDPGGPHLYPNYSIYSGPPSHMKDFTSRAPNLGPAPTPVVHPSPQSPSLFAAEEIRCELMHRSAVTLSQPNPSAFPDIPAQIDHFHEICPIETHIQKASTFCYPSTVYKAINSKNGFTYCLRRIHGFRLPSGKWLGMIEAWKNISHTNLVQLREIFTTKAFGDNSLIFVYDYFPSADTLMQRHFDRNNQMNGYVDPFSSDPAVPRPYSHQKNALLRHHANMLPENLVWAYIVQLSSVIRTIHSAGLSVRCMDPSKILLTSRTRPAIRLNCCGIYDLVTFDPNTNPATMVSFYQQEDLVAFGKLLLALACNSILAIQREHLNTSMELISRTYSADLRNMIAYLMNPRAGTTRSVNDIMPMIGARFYNQLDAANIRAEILETGLSRELENGRLFRLIVKLNTVLERFNLDPAWSETGDRYLLKLFRDYVFHQVTPDGRPYLDLSHVTYCLNRLDAGCVDKVCLMSHDEQSILITNYAELKHCLDQSFGELLHASNSHVKNNHLHHHPNMPQTHAHWVAQQVQALLPRYRAPLVSYEGHPLNLQSRSEGLSPNVEAPPPSADPGLSCETLRPSVEATEPSSEAPGPSKKAVIPSFEIPGSSRQAFQNRHEVPGFSGEASQLFDVPQLNGEGFQPSFEVPGSSRQATQRWSEALEPEFQGYPGNSGEAMQPYFFGVPHCYSEVTQPTFEAPRFSAEAIQPSEGPPCSAEAIQPSEGPRFNEEVNQPSLEVPGSSREAARPGFEATGFSGGATRPRYEVPRFSGEAIHPSGGPRFSDETVQPAFEVPQISGEAFQCSFKTPRPRSQPPFEAPRNGFETTESWFEARRSSFEARRSRQSSLGSDGPGFEAPLANDGAVGRLSCETPQSNIEAAGPKVEDLRSGLEAPETRIPVPGSGFQPPPPNFAAVGSRFDGRRSGFKGQRPNFKATGSRVENRLHGFVAPGSHVQASGSNFTPAGPRFDVRRSGFECQRPNFNATGSRVENRLPGFVAPGSHVQASGSYFAAAGPRFEVRRSGFENQRPRFRAPGSGFQAPRPNFEVLRPSYQAFGHGFQNPRPRVQSPRPSYQGPRPSYPERRF